MFSHRCRMDPLNSGHCLISPPPINTVQHLQAGNPDRETGSDVSARSNRPRNAAPEQGQQLLFGLGPL